MVRDMLGQLDVELECADVLCDNGAHLHDIDRVTCELLGVITDSAWENLEYSKGTTGDQASRKYTIPGWNDRVKPFQNEAKFWNSLWISAGKPK